MRIMTHMEKTLPQPRGAVKNRQAVAQLRGKRRELARQIARVEAQISRLQPGRKAIPVEQLDRLLDDLSAGLTDLPPLPHDFSRADLYEDHD